MFVVIWSQKQFPYHYGLLVLEPNSENCLDLIFATPPCEKVFVVSDTNYITPAIRKLMLDMSSPGSFQDIGLLIGAQSDGSLNADQKCLYRGPQAYK